jgi:hypothetical protein
MIAASMARQIVMNIPTRPRLRLENPWMQFQLLSASDMVETCSRQKLYIGFCDVVADGRVKLLYTFCGEILLSTVLAEGASKR